VSSPFTIVLVQDRGAEDGHDGIPDELLDRAPDEPEIGAKVGVIRPEDGPDILGVQVFGLGTNLT
jgi:hypothetical protein